MPLPLVVLSVIQSASVVTVQGQWFVAAAFLLSLFAAVMHRFLSGAPVDPWRGWIYAAMFFFLGPVYVLMPYVVKNALHGGAQGLGLVFAAGGVGAIVASLVVGQRGLPRRPLTVVFVAWSGTAFSLVGYAAATAVWQAMIVSFFSVACLTTGGIVWNTLLQRAVPSAMIGRVSSVDGLLSAALAPISYVLTGPVADELGAKATLFRAGIASSAVMLLVLLLVPAVHNEEEIEQEAVVTA